MENNMSIVGYKRNRKVLALERSVPWYALNQDDKLFLIGYKRKDRSRKHTHTRLATPIEIPAEESRLICKNLHPESLDRIQYTPKPPAKLESILPTAENMTEEEVANASKG
jgi:hypothetical protein